MGMFTGKSEPQPPPGAVCGPDQCSLPSAEKRVAFTVKTPVAALRGALLLNTAPPPPNCRVRGRPRPSVL